ncbi:MAG: DUF5996 family protein [Acidobacteriota bacterium]
MARSTSSAGAWPALPVARWRDTLETLHLWTQVVGKVRLVCAPWLNHSWSVPLYVTTRGLSTGLVPYETRAFELAFDLFDNALVLTTTDGQRREVVLKPRSVADFYAAVRQRLADAGLPVIIHTTPNEIPGAIPFPEDTAPRVYKAAHAQALWQALVHAERVFTRFRAGFRGKSSPVHFFWGSFDLAVTRFSGRTAPPHPGGVPNFPDDVAQEAYSHEVTSVGFWPGNRDAPDPIFYAYAYPTPDGFADATVAPAEAFWLDALGEFALTYEAVRTADDPDAHLLAFLESTHAAAADLAGWDRDALECARPHGPDWWHTRGARSDASD